MYLCDINFSSIKNVAPSEGSLHKLMEMGIRITKVGNAHLTLSREKIPTLRKCYFRAETCSELEMTVFWGFSHRLPSLCSGFVLKEQRTDLCPRWLSESLKTRRTLLEGRCKDVTVKEQPPSYTDHLASVVSLSQVAPVRRLSAGWESEEPRSQS